MTRVLVLAFCLLAAALPARSAEPPVILVVGDSLSAGYGLVPGQGWVTLLQQRLKNQGYGYRVVNASVSGETKAPATPRRSTAPVIAASSSARDVAVAELTSMAGPNAARGTSAKHPPR